MGTWQQAMPTQLLVHRPGGGSRPGRRRGSSTRPTNRPGCAFWTG